MTRAQRSGKALIVAVSERDVVETKNPSSKLNKGQLCRIQLSVSSLNRIGHKTVSQIMAWLAQQELLGRQVQLQPQERQLRSQLLELQLELLRRAMELGLGCSQLARNP